jgi:hypothetical protein
MAYGYPVPSVALARRPQWFWRFVVGRTRVGAGAGLAAIPVFVVVAIASAVDRDWRRTAGSLLYLVPLGLAARPNLVVFRQGNDRLLPNSPAVGRLRLEILVLLGTVGVLLLISALLAVAT